jgi:glucosamine-6-phosphate deaminase
MPARAHSLSIEVAPAAQAARAVAAEIAELVRDRARGAPAAVLGLATGRTPLELYAELARMHREQGLELGRVLGFGLDEYLGLPPDHPQTFGRYLLERVIAPCGMDPGRVRLLPSDPAPARIEAHCRDYERAIAEAGGIDLVILGIGRNGHIGFNEPGSKRESRTRSVRLAAETREDAARAFGGLERVPERALAVGVATILEARRIRVLGFGERKRPALRRMLEDPIGPALPATFLREHADVRLYTDAHGGQIRFPPST